MSKVFTNRHVAGRQLAKKLAQYRHCVNGLVLGLPRGGVPVAYEIALALALPLDVFVVRKLGVPGHEELAMGAIAAGGLRLLNEDVVRYLRPSASTIAAVTAKEQIELERRMRAYRGTRAPLQFESRTVILVDDGLATGSTMRAAIAALRQQNPARLVVAVPVAPLATYYEIKAQVDEMVAIYLPENLQSVSGWYEDFSQTTDEEVCQLLAQATPRRTAVMEGNPSPLASRHGQEGGSIMATKEIPRDQWVEFFDGFSKRHEGWLATIEVLQSDIGAQTEAERLPFVGISADVKDNENRLEIRLGNQPNSGITHAITSPTCVQVKQNEEGEDEALEIESSDGEITLLRFRRTAKGEFAG